MQISPSELNKMSLWEFAAMVQGWNKANGSSDGKAEDSLEDKQADELFDFIQEKPVWVN